MRRHTSREVVLRRAPRARGRRQPRRGGGARRRCSGCGGTRRSACTTVLPRSKQSQAFAPDVILLDLDLPKLDGYEVARRVRRGPGGSRIVLIALTGFGQEQYVVRDSGSRLRSPLRQADRYLHAAQHLAAAARRSRGGGFDAGYIATRAEYGGIATTQVTLVARRAP